MAEDADQALHVRNVDYMGGETTFQGYLAILPPVVEPRHAWCSRLGSGLNDPTKRLADRYARMGYVCFAVDVYGKSVRGDPFGDNSDLMDPLMTNRALLHRRLQAGLAEACRLSGVDATRMAVVGYCSGGMRLGPAGGRASKP